MLAVSRDGLPALLFVFYTYGEFSRGTSVVANEKWYVVDLDEILRIGMPLKLRDVTNWFCSVDPSEERQLLVS